MIGGKTSHGQQKKLGSELERHYYPDSGRFIVGELGEH